MTRAPKSNLAPWEQAVQRIPGDPPSTRQGIPERRPRAILALSTTDIFVSKKELYRSRIENTSSVFPRLLSTTHQTYQGLFFLLLELFWRQRGICPGRHLSFWSWGMMTFANFSHDSRSLLDHVGLLDHRGAVPQIPQRPKAACDSCPD